MLVRDLNNCKEVNQREQFMGIWPLQYSVLSMVIYYTEKNNNNSESRKRSE